MQILSKSEWETMIMNGSWYSTMTHNPNIAGSVQHCFNRFVRIKKKLFAKFIYILVNSHYHKENQQEHKGCFLDYYKPINLLRI